MDEGAIAALVFLGLGIYFLTRLPKPDLTPSSDFYPGPSNQLQQSFYPTDVTEEYFEPPMVDITPGLFPSYDPSLDTTLPGLLMPTSPTNSARTPSALTTSNSGQQNIIHFEGWKRTPYQLKGIWHIGVGHKFRAGDGMTPQTVLTDGQVQQLFLTDLEEAENYLKSYVSVPLTQNQFDALVDFIYNEGVGNFASSTLRTLLNQRDYNGAANEFKRWVYATDANGVKAIDQTLVSRRLADEQLFRT